MARGDEFGINVSIDNKYDVTIMGVCDTSLIENLPEGVSGWNNESITVYGENFADVAAKIDSYIPYTWQAVKIPVRLPFSNDNYNTLLRNFPGIYTIGSLTSLSGKNIYYNNNVVPPSDVKIIVDSQTGTQQSYTYAANRLQFSENIPAIAASVVYSDYYPAYYIGYTYMIFPDDFLKAGKINVNGLSKVYYVYIDIAYYPKKYEGQEYGVSIYYRSNDINTENKDFWNEEEVKFVNLTPDPYDKGGTTSGGHGGSGDFNNTSTPVNIPSLPSVSAVSTGFITLFNPSISQLQELANYMWSELFDLDTLRKLFADPMDAILGLSIVPVSVPNGGTSLVTVGNISTGVSMTRAASQYVAVDCGVINVNEYWGAYLDYDPFTKAEIYLPYIGTHPIAVDDIMGKSVHVVYHVDILSGACCAYIQCGESVLYSFIGQCSFSIPVTGNDWTNVINGALNIAGAIGSMVATGGATAPMAVGAIASTAVNSFKPAVEKSGSISGMGGMLGIQAPYLILTRPRQALPYNQNKFIGYPSFVTAKLGELSGYTEIDSVHLEGIPATDDELSEIESLLKSGVIF